MPLDLPFAFRQSESRSPIVLLYSQEANMVEKLVIEGAQKKQVWIIKSIQFDLVMLEEKKDSPVRLSCSCKVIYYIGKLVRDEKENSDWFSERSEFCKYGSLITWVQSKNWSKHA